MKKFSDLFLHQFLDKPVATYVHTGNKEIVVSAVTISTDAPANTFTSIAHGLADGDIIAPILNFGSSATYPNKVYPGGMAQTLYYVVGKTDNTFQISLTIGGAAIAISTNADMNLTKWHFERRIASSVVISGLPALTKMRATFNGRLLQVSGGSAYFYPSNAWQGNNFFVGTSLYNIAQTISANISCFIEITVGISPFAVFRIRGKAYGANNATTVLTSEVDTYAQSLKNNFTAMTTFTIDLQSNGFIANGSVLEVYRA